MMSQTMDDLSLLAMLEEALEMEAGVLRPETSIESVSEWDSVGWLAVMSIVDEKLNIRLDTAKIPNFLTVSEVIEHIQSKLK